MLNIIRTMTNALHALLLSWGENLDDPKFLGKLFFHYKTEVKKMEFENKFHMDCICVIQSEKKKANKIFWCVGGHILSTYWLMLPEL